MGANNWTSLCVAGLLWCLRTLCEGLPFGAPEAACLDMTPRLLAPGLGHGSGPQSQPHPYNFIYKEIDGVYTGEQDFT